MTLAATVAILWVALIAAIPTAWVFYGLYRSERACRLKAERKIRELEYREEVYYFGRELRRTNDSSDREELYWELTKYLPGSFRITVHDEGVALIGYCFQTPAWQDEKIFEGDNAADKIQVRDGEGMLVIIESALTFDDVGFHNSGNFIVSYLAEALWDNAMLTREHRMLSQENWQLGDQVSQLGSQVKLDELTGLLNRRGLTDRLNEEIERALRSQESLCVAMLDLDGFKEINDSFGHHVGDVALKAFGEVLQTEDRWPDVCARLGGDEFVIIFPETNERGALVALRRIMRDLAEVRIDGFPKIRLQTSVGVASLRWVEKDRRVNGARKERAEMLLEQADKALYKAKDTGKNRIVAWTPVGR